MANSESEDFESADEGGMRSYESGEQLCQKIHEDHPVVVDTSPSQIQRNSDESIPEAASLEIPQSHYASSVGSSVAVINSVGSSDVKHEVSKQPSNTLSGPLSSRLLNPESLGAKPKLLQKSKTKSHSKHRSHQVTTDVAGSVHPSVNPNNQETSQRKRSTKLGVKIPPPSILPSEIVAQDNNKFKGKLRVPWTKNDTDTNADNQDLHDSIQPLLDKLASLDVVDPSEEIGDTSDDSSIWSAWGAWMMSGASSVSSHVSQGLSTVSSAIESGLGAVDPEEMAKINVEGSKSCSDTLVHEDDSETSERTPSFNVMGNVLKFVESTGEMIVTSGLNTLESLGKKTMDVLQEGDPGLRKKRAMFFREPDKPNLSQILKEARVRAEVEDKERAQAKLAVRAHFEMLFDDYKGMVHLEAFEMLSNTCQLKLEAKLHILSGTPLIEFQRTLIQIKEQCDILDDEEEDDEDYDRGSIEVLEREITAAMRNLMVPLSHAKLIRVCEDTDAWLATMRCMQDESSQNENDEWLDEEDVADDSDPQNNLQDIHEQAIRGLAKFTAAAVEHFHKTAELILLKDEHNTFLECQCVVTMISLVCSRVSSVAARFSELLSATANTVDSSLVDHNDVNLLITNIFLEASNSSSYIQDASLLFIPVIQLGAVQ